MYTSDVFPFCSWSVGVFGRSATSVQVAPGVRYQIASDPAVVDCQTACILKSIQVPLGYSFTTGSVRETEYTSGDEICPVRMLT
jgi:hypothetical protein